MLYGILWQAESINERNPPLRIRISGTTQMGDSARQVVQQFRELATEARGLGTIVNVEFE